MVDKRIPALTTETTKNFSQKVILDRVPEFSEAKNMDIGTLLRSEVPQTANATSQSTYTLDYAEYDTYTALINEDCAFTLDNIPIGSTAYLKVIKDVEDIVTFVGVTGTRDSKQVGLTELFFEIEKRTDKFYVNQANNQFSNSLVIGNLTSGAGTIISFAYFKSKTNNNICNFDSEFTFESSAGLVTNIININIANWGVTKEESAQSSGNITCRVNGVWTASSILINSTSLKIELGTTISNTDVITIWLSGAFQII